MLPIILAIEDENDRNYVADVYEKYKKKLFYIANRVLNHEQDSLDCVQEVVVALINCLQDYQTWDRHHQMCFLYKCCKNNAINRYKEKKNQIEKEFSTTDLENRKDFDFEDRNSNLENIVINEETRKIIAESIDEMDAKYSDLLFFKYFCNMKNIDIAKMLSLPINTVNGRLLRAKEQLAERLSKVI